MKRSERLPAYCAWTSQCGPLLAVATAEEIDASDDD